MKVDIGPYKNSDWNNDEGRKIDIHIDDYDIHNLDHTLALITLPCLKKLKEQKQGSHNVDPLDVPQDIRQSEEDIQSYKAQGLIDDNFNKRWDWVLDEMIFAMSSITEDDGLFDVSNPDYENLQQRIQYGCYLFGKYFTCLWD